MNPNSMQQLFRWRNEILSKINVGVYFPIVVIGSKIDLKVDYCIKQKDKENDFHNISYAWSKIPSVLDEKINSRYEESEKARLAILQWCRDNSYSHFDASAKTNIGVKEAILVISAKALRASVINEKKGCYGPQGKKIDLENLYTLETKGLLKKFWDFLVVG
jgi:GTPase SAR1 family protein